MRKLALGLLALTAVVHTLPAQDFEVSPVVLNFNCDPGATQVKTITVKNHGNSTQSFLVSLSDFSINAQGKREYGAANTTKRGLGDWITITPMFFETAPGGEQEISISVQPPVDEYGSRWGSLSIRTAAEKMSFEADKSLSAGVTLSSSIMVDIFQTSRGSGVLSAKIDQLRATEIQPDGRRRFTALLSNNSDVILTCKVYLILSDIATGNETVYPPIRLESFPKVTQRIELDLPKDIPAGTYALAAILDYDGSSSLEGTQMVLEIK